MADTVLVPLPDGRWLALTSEAFRAALAEGQHLSASAAPSSAAKATSKLISAEEMQEATGVPASWFAAQARERRIPFHKLGRYVRFNLEEVMACEALQRRAVPPGRLCTGSQNRKAHVSG
ncbi:MAG: hypothetical protein ACRD3Q_13590 [Terriglobales bacterium]